MRTASNDAPTTDTEREALIERLLLAGLDHYFDGRYEQAVNVWTRVAFLERGHGRARAYIERARGALAERQRQADEIVHRGVSAYENGDLQAARQLLTRAIAEGATNETALIFLQRLGRLEATTPGAWLAQPPPVFSGHGQTGSTASTLMRSRHPVAAVARTWVATAVASIGVAAAILLAAQPIASWLGERPISAPVVDVPPAGPLPIVRVSETRLARARQLYDDGQLLAALRVLDEVDVADPLRVEADQIKAAVQRDLLAAGVPAPTRPPEPPQ